MSFLDTRLADVKRATPRSCCNQITTVSYRLNLSLRKFLKDTTSCINSIWKEKQKNYQKRMRKNLWHYVDES
jgi:hypothetical protein